MTASETKNSEPQPVDAGVVDLPVLARAAGDPAEHGEDEEGRGDEDGKGDRRHRQFTKKDCADLTRHND